MNGSVKYWLDIADYDLDVAKAMLQTGKYLYICKKMIVETEELLCWIKEQL